MSLSVWLCLWVWLGVWELGEKGPVEHMAPQVMFRLQRHCCSFSTGQVEFAMLPERLLERRLREAPNFFDGLICMHATYVCFSSSGHLHSSGGGVVGEVLEEVMELQQRGSCPKEGFA